MQMLLPLNMKDYPVILKQPILRAYSYPGLHVPVHVVGGTYAGDEFIYLNHIFGKIAHAGHQVGSTNDVERRLKAHRRKWPLFKLTVHDIDELALLLPEDVLDALLPLQDRNYRRHHTFERALKKSIGPDALQKHQRPIFSQAKKHQGSPLLMAANRRGISWDCVQIWQADRQLEFAIKHYKKTRCFCPVCQGVDIPF